MSEFAFLFRGRNRQIPAEQHRKTMQRWSAWMKELNESGVITNPGQPLDDGGKIIEGRAKVVNDGPFAEIKDVVNGFIVVEVPNLDAAIEVAMACPIFEDGGSVEVRPVRRFRP